MALFSLKNDAANCASFTYNAQRYRYGWQWHVGREVLNAVTLQAHLNNQRNNALKELARLILAQGDHNVNENTNPTYTQPNQRQDDFIQTDTVQHVREHMFDHGHMGWYPFCVPYNNSGACVQTDPKSSSRGIFNIDNVILRRIVSNNCRSWILCGAASNPPRLRGYNIDSDQTGKGSLFDTANNIIKALFFGNITVNKVEKIEVDEFENPIDNSFAIDVTYNDPIGGLNQPIGIKKNGRDGTNDVRIVVGIRDGRISLVSIFPLDKKRP